MDNMVQITWSILCFFILFWQCFAQNQKVPLCELSKDVFVQFHGWKYTDIKNECDSSDSRYYCAFVVPPPFEHQEITLDFPPNAQNPWWQKYNVISWKKLVTEAGTDVEFNEMLNECNANNIRIYVDFEMTNTGDNTGPGYGTAGSYYDGRPDYYSYGHFSGEFYYHQSNTPAPDGCSTGSGIVEDETDAAQVRYCSRLGSPITSMSSPVSQMNDLRTSLAQVKDGYIEQMNILLNGDGNALQGVAGFRLAHARWVPPEDLVQIANSTEDIKIPGTNGLRPLFISDVLPDNTIGASGYNEFGLVEESRAGPLLSDIIRRQHPSYMMSNLSDWGENMGLMPSSDAVVYIDDAYSQRGWPSLSDLDVVLRFDDERNYAMANAFMLADPYGYPRIHSSYTWNRVLVDDNGMTKDLNDYEGPPRDSNGNIADVVVSADTYSCEGNWNCEHRWKTNRNMARFRNLVKQLDGGETKDNFWTNGYHQIAFSRGNVGFFAINNEPTQDLIAKIPTSLPAGSYCDIVTGDNPNADPCEGRTITVGSDGRANVDIRTTDEWPYVAIVAY